MTRGYILYGNPQHATLVDAYRKIEPRFFDVALDSKIDSRAIAKSVGVELQCLLIFVKRALFLQLASVVLPATVTWVIWSDWVEVTCFHCAAYGFQVHLYQFLPKTCDMSDPLRQQWLSYANNCVKNITKIH